MIIIPIMMQQKEIPGDKIKKVPKFMLYLDSPFFYSDDKGRTFLDQIQ